MENQVFSLEREFDSDSGTYKLDEGDHDAHKVGRRRRMKAVHTLETERDTHTNIYSTKMCVHQNSMDRMTFTPFTLLLFLCPCLSPSLCITLWDLSPSLKFLIAKPCHG